MVVVVLLKVCFLLLLASFTPDSADNAHRRGKFGDPFVRHRACHRQFSERLSISGEFSQFTVNIHVMGTFMNYVTLNCDLSLKQLKESFWQKSKCHVGATLRQLLKSNVKLYFDRRLKQPTKEAIPVIFVYRIKTWVERTAFPTHLHSRWETGENVDRMTAFRARGRSKTFQIDSVIKV